MRKIQWAILCALGIVLMTPAIGSADVVLTGPAIEGSGCGNAFGTSSIRTFDNDERVGQYGMFDDQDIESDNDASIYHHSYAEARDGTASTGAQGMFTNTQTIGDDTVTAATDGKTETTLLNKYA